MNVRTLFGVQFSRRYGFIHGLRTLDGVWRLWDVGLRRLLLHTVRIATYLPS